MELTTQDIHSIISTAKSRRGDSTSIEIKSAQGGVPRSLPETVCAFANMPAGGLILLGISEKDNFNVCGVDNPAELEQAVVSQAQAVVPAPTVSTQVILFEGKSVVAAYVHELTLADKPAKFRGQPYLRQADGDYVMPITEQRMIAHRQLTRSPDVAHDRMEVTDTSLEDADPALVAGALEPLRSAIRPLAKVDDATALRMLGLSTSTGQLTRAGLYALGSFPQGPLPCLAVTAAVRLASDRLGRTKNLETFYGPLGDLLDQSMTWVKRNIDWFQQYQDNGHMMDVPEIPLIVIREIIANALVHRDLSSDSLAAGKTIDIRLEPDRLIISSPGGFSPDKFTRVEVNQSLYRVAKVLTDPHGQRIIEGESGGVHTVLTECARAGLRAPTFVDTGVKLTVIFWRGQATTESVVEAQLMRALQAPSKESAIDLARLGKNVPAIWSAANELGENFTAIDVAEVSGLNISQVRYGLKPLIHEGLLRIHGGQGKANTTYSLR